MDPRATHLEALTRRYREALLALGVRVERVLVFGSWASGQAHEGSDVDLVIVSPDFEGKGLRERLETLGVAAARIPEPVQAVGFTPNEIDNGRVTPFWEDILRHEARAVG